MTGQGSWWDREKKGFTQIAADKDADGRRFLVEESIVG